MTGNGKRVAWLDIARGGTIALVVLWHSYLSAASLGPVDPVVILLNDKLATVRMPLFFFCSGVLASRALSRSWPEYLSGRIWIMVWVYVLWTVLTVAVEQFYTVYPWHRSGGEIWRLLWHPYGVLWFIYGLILVSLVARAVAPLSRPLQIAAVALLQIALWWAAPEFGNLPAKLAFTLGKLAEYGLAFFMAGVWCAGPALRELSARRSAVAGALAGVALSVAVIAFQQLYADLPRLVTAGPAVLAALALSALIPAGSRGAGWLSWLGRRTLEIFLMHQFLAGLATYLCAALGVAPTLAIALVFGLSLAGSCLFAWAVGRFGPRLLLRPPALRLRRTLASPAAE